MTLNDKKKNKEAETEEDYKEPQEIDIPVQWVFTNTKNYKIDIF